MKTLPIAIALALAASSLTALAQDPAGSPPPGGEGHRGGRALSVLPPRAEQQLNLTADQKKQVADLDAEVKTKLEQILTADQLAQLKQLRPQGGRGHGGPGEGGPGKPTTSGTTSQP